VAESTFKTELRTIGEKSAKSHRHLLANFRFHLR